MDKEKIVRGVYNVFQENTQERPTETNVMIRTGPKRISLPPSLIVFQAAAYLCATKLNASTNRILMFFFAKSAYENYIGIDIKTLMEELNMSKPTVVNGLKELELSNILIKYQNINDNRRHDYFINPVTAWKGNSFTRNQKIKFLTSKDPKQLDLFVEK
jgi:hypothetical protein